MEITIKGNAKEIASLVSELQGRQRNLKFIWKEGPATERKPVPIEQQIEADKTIESIIGNMVSGTLIPSETIRTIVPEIPIAP